MAEVHALHELAARFWQFQRHEFPLTALLAGEANDDPTMFREAPGDFDRRAKVASEMLAELRGIAVHALSLQDRCTHRLLQRELADLRDAHAVLSHLRPWLLPVGPEFNTIYFANLSTVGDAAAAARYVERLATLPGFFADVQACLQQGQERGLHRPRIVLQRWLASLRAAVQGEARSLPWYGPLVRSGAAARPGVVQQAERAERVIEQGIVPALRGLARFVEETLLPAAREGTACREEPLGREYYAFWARHFTTRETLSPEAIHELGLAEVARLQGEIEGIAAHAGHAGDVAGYRAFLARDAQFIAPSAEALRAQVEVVCKRIDRQIPAFFGRLPRTTYGVESIPAALSERMPPAYAQPNPADGSSSGIYWVSSLPHKCPSYLHVPLALHEGWPGHLMHIALMQEMSALPAFRRANFTKHTACLEGWALYCEQLGIDMQLYQTPHQHYGRLDMEMWRACRLVVDTGLHVHGWSRAQGIAFMQQQLSLSTETIAAEVDRYIAMPAQALAYQIGGLALRALRERAQQRLGERFELRRYHDQLMAAGAVTLPLLDEIVDEWLAAEELHHAA